MNFLDLAIIAALLAAAIGGFRLGFVARAFAWGGVAVGLIIGIHYVPRVVTAFGGTSADDRVTVAVLFLVLLATLGQALGLALGVIVHRFSAESTPLPAWDRAAGAAIGLFGVLLLVWMTIPALSTAKGWPARMARGSAVIGFLDDLAPDQPEEFAAWGRAISDAPYPSALGPLDEPPDPGLPPSVAIPTTIDRDVRQSMVKVSGRACNQIQEGSGWVAPNGHVVTNAHVVAGERESTVEDANGEEHSATVIGFDPVSDLAVLEVPSLDAPGLTLGAGRVNDVGAVYGHPGGGVLRAAPARIAQRITAVGTNIYRTGDSRRDVFVLAAALAPGDSGGPLVNEAGEVMGVAFAVDPANEGTSFALTADEVRAILEAVRLNGGDEVDSGDCLVA